jgi:hypothetical protein
MFFKQLDAMKNHERLGDHDAMENHERLGDHDAMENHERLGDHDAMENHERDGDGLDMVKYSVASDTVFYNENSHGQLEINSTYLTSETLASVERLQFTDKFYALDVDGNAGIAAKAIIATFGADALTSYMAAAVSVVDGGTSLGSLCDLVVANNLIENEIGSSSNGSFVDHVYENIVGTAPNSTDHDTYTALLDNGTYTKSSLLALAANTTLAENLVTENSVDLIGVPGSADGEILALQYDIGLG